VRPKVEQVSKKEIAYMGSFISAQLIAALYILLTCFLPLYVCTSPTPPACNLDNRIAVSLQALPHLLGFEKCIAAVACAAMQKPFAVSARRSFQKFYARHSELEITQDTEKL